MSEAVVDYGALLRSVDRFLRRYTDPFTCRNRDDLAQEAVIETWRRGPTMRDPACVFAFARTVARRLRYRAIHRATAMRRRVAEVGLAAAEDLAVRDGDDRPALRVGGEWVEVDWLVERIGEVLGDLGPLNEPIVRGYYAGSSCRELGARYGLPPAGVKARIYRGRARIRSGFTERVRNAHRTGPSGRSRRSNCNDSEGDE